METWLGPAVLALVGLAAIAFGALVWRSAAAIVEDARRTLLAMFGEGFPGLFTAPPDPRSARIAGVAMVGLGVVAVGAAGVLVIVR